MSFDFRNLADSCGGCVATEEKSTPMESSERDQYIAELVALADEPGRWDDTDPEALRQAMYLGLMRYGITNDPAEVFRLIPLYRVVVKRSTVEERLELLGHVVEAVEEQVSSGNALMPFIMIDPDRYVVSSAALDLAVTIPGDDPLTGPREVLRIALEEVPDVAQTTRAAILTGLLLLGDRRVMALLDRCWERLDDAHRGVLASARSGLVAAGMVDYYLDWLDDCIEDGNDGLFGTVAARLARMTLENAGGGQVIEVERAFPVWSASDGQPVRDLQTWSFEEYGRVIEPRLRDLLARESEPKVLPMVMQMWRLEA
ncbi:MAG TPA: hypothetical protein DEU95_14260 [Chloroflexi bacterium]|nr:hypothetical protein [Chloroflexota bacterium]